MHAIFDSHQLEMSFLNICWSVMWSCTTSPKMQHKKRLKRQHGQLQVRGLITWWTVLIILWSPTVKRDCIIPYNPIMWLIFYFIFFKQTALHAELENFKSRKMFILVSTVMTWAMTKPQNPVSLEKIKASFRVVLYIKNPTSVIIISLFRRNQMFCWRKKSSEEEGLIPVSETTTIWRNLCSNWVEGWVDYSDENLNAF